MDTLFSYSDHTLSPKTRPQSYRLIRGPGPSLYPRVDQAERQGILHYMAKHPPESRDQVTAYAYALAGCPDDLAIWLVTPAAQDAISAVLAATADTKP
jgi:hypothetical protein